MADIAKLNGIGITTIDNTHALVSFSEYSTTNLKACYLTLDGTTVKADPVVAVKNASCFYVNTCTMNSTHVLTSFSNVSDNSKGLVDCITLG